VIAKEARVEGGLTVDDQTPSRKQLLELYVTDHVPPNKMQVVVEGPTISALTLEAGPNS
jgi:hypothetical protein